MHEQGSEIAVANDADLAAGSMLSVQVGSKYLLLIKDRQGVVSVLEDKCSHAEVRLSRGKLTCFDAGGGEVQCPAHGACFDVRSGKQLCMPAVTPVKAFPSRVSEGKIMVLLEQRR